MESILAVDYNKDYSKFVVGGVSGDLKVLHINKT